MHNIRAYKKYVPEGIWKSLRSLWLSGRYCASLVTPTMRTLTYCGYRIHYLRGNSLVERLEAEPIFEKVMCEQITHDLQGKGDPVFMDVGANIGLISAYVLSTVPRVHVYAFEPGPKQATLLKQTITTNSLESRCTLSTCALSNTSGEQVFYVHPNRDYAKDGLQDTGRGERTKAITVKTRTLDEWWEENKRPSVHVVKIDTEGAELLIMRGARKFIAHARPVLYLEIEPSNLRAYPYTAFDLLGELHTSGYEVRTLAGELVTSENLVRAMEHEDTFRASPL